MNDHNGYTELARQNHLYETIISNTPDLVYVFDLNYRFTFANEAILQMWGRTFEESVGKSLLEVGYEPWHAEMHEKEIDQIVRTKQPVRGEVAFQHSKLGKRIYDYILVPVFNDKNEVVSVAGTTRDITERKKNEFSDALLSAIINDSDDAIISKNL
ncbi:MAG: PAS domain-containing protein, partial [Balneolaceae bacterium]